MPRITRLAVLPGLMIMAACGGTAQAPTAPTSLAAFTIGAGNYSLRVAGSSSCVATSAHGAPAAPTEITLNVVLASSGSGWTMTLPGQSLSGRVTGDSLNVAIALKGQASVGTVKFLTDTNAQPELSLGGSARNGERFDGVITSGRAIFESLGGIGSASASCAEGTFTLRRAG